MIKSKLLSSKSMDIVLIGLVENCCAKIAMTELSIPPLKKTPTGTSATKCFLTASSSKCLVFAMATSALSVIDAY